MKALRKVFFYAIGVFGVVLVSMILATLFFKDRIIDEFIRKANQNLSTPIQIGKIDVSVFQDFPHLSIVFRDVYVEDSHAGLYPLLTANIISFQLNPIEVYRGKYTINGIHVTDCEANLKINSKGENNYTIIKKSDGGDGDVAFELKNVLLENVKVNYTDLLSNQDFTYSSDKLDASISTSNDIYEIAANGNVNVEKMQVKGQGYFEGKDFNIRSSISYDDIARSVKINPSLLSLKESQFNIEGNYEWKNKKLIDITARGKDSDIQTLLSLLPERSSKQFAKYKSNGGVYFSAKLKGEISENKNPSLSVEFGLKNTRLVHPETNSSLDGVSVEGSFASSDVNDLTKATLVLKNISGKLDQEQFQANLVASNLVDSDVILDFKGKLDANSLFNFYPIKGVEMESGLLAVDVSFSGRLSWLSKKSTARKAIANGSIEMQNLNFKFGEQDISVERLNGNLRFDNNDLALSNVYAKIENSDFTLNGFFKNVITFLLFENQPIGIEADLKSNFLDLDQLFAIGFGSSQKSDEYEFNISKNLQLNFNCNVAATQYKRFKGKTIRGNLLVKDQVAVGRDISLKTMGGELKLSGIVDAKNPKAIDVVSTLNLDGIHIDTVFYVFENFGQTFIEDRHLRGKATADVSLEMTLNQKLKLFPETLIADIGTTIKNGELNNFEPMQKLRKYLDDDGLDRLRFADLKNDIHIENKTVYIPQMIVQSNVTTIQISGTHTFDQRIDYRVITPLISRKKIDMTEAAGAIETLDGQAKLFLKIIGTTDDYKVIYDTEAVKKKIVADLKKEVQELKDAFKTKGLQKKKTLELSTEEFDWDNNQQ